MSTANAGLVLNTTCSGTAACARRCRSSAHSRGRYGQAPARACPRTVARVAYTTLTALETRPAQPTYWRLTPQVDSPFFSCPDSSSTTTARGSSPAPRCCATNPATTPIAAFSSHTAWLSSRCVLSGRASPAHSAICHPFLRGTSAVNARTYLPACNRGSRRANTAPTRPNSSFWHRTDNRLQPVVVETRLHDTPLPVPTIAVVEDEP